MFFSAALYRLSTASDCYLFPSHLFSHREVIATITSISHFAYLTQPGMPYA